jgi:hypothetical protein
LAEAQARWVGDDPVLQPVFIAANRFQRRRLARADVQAHSGQQGSSRLKIAVFGHPAYAEKTTLKANDYNVILIFSRIAPLVG